MLRQKSMFVIGNVMSAENERVYSHVLCSGAGASNIIIFQWWIALHGMSSKMSKYNFFILKANKSVLLHG